MHPDVFLLDVEELLGLLNGSIGDQLFIHIVSSFFPLNVALFSDGQRCLSVSFRIGLDHHARREAGEVLDRVDDLRFEQFEIDDGDIFFFETKRSGSFYNATLWKKKMK